MPPTALVNAYLTEIARGYGVKWAPPDDADDPAPSTDDVDDAPDGGVKVRDTHDPIPHL